MRQDESGPRIYWIVHGTNLLRCAPEHVRPDVSDEGCVLFENLNQAMEMLGNMKRTGVTQLHDISSHQPPSERPGDSDVDVDDDEVGDEDGQGSRRQRTATTSPSTETAAPPPLPEVPDPPAQAA